MIREQNNSLSRNIVSISLGSSRRDKTVNASFLGRNYRISRIGTDGSLEKFAKLVREYDGRADAIGLGGIDLYFYTVNRRYTVADAYRLASIAQKTPVVDGSGLKNTLERRAVEFIQKQGILNLSRQKVLMVCAVDRFGMAQAIDQTGAKVVYGDLMFNLGIPIPIRSYSHLCTVAGLLLPVVTRLPFQWLYPTGSRQEEITPRYPDYYRWASVIAGDWHIIRRSIPTSESKCLKGKIILTNTITPDDVELLRQRGVKTLITTTPSFNGRHFATNVMEALLVSMLEKPLDKIKPEDYNSLLDKLDFKPQIVEL